MRKLYLLFFLLSASTLSAQDFLGFSNSNYAGVAGIDLQPASIVDSRFKVDISLVGFSLSGSNNYAGIKGSAFRKDAAGVYPFEYSDFEDNYIVTRGGKGPRSLYGSNQIVLPSFMVTLNSKSALAFNWRIRSYANVDGVEDELATLIRNGLNYSPLWLQRLENKNLSLQTMSWAEYGLTYGRVLMDRNEHFLKGALRVKVLQGLQAAYLFVKDLQYEFTTDTTLSLFQSDVNYGHSTNFEMTGNSIKYQFVSNFSLGFDLGVVYEWRPQYQKYKYDMDGKTDLWRRDQNKYKLKLGFSAIDIGGIKFKKGELSNDFTADINFWNLSNLDFSGTPIQAFDDTIRARFGQRSSDPNFKMNLPTALSAQVDYHVWKDMYVNFTSFYAFQHRRNKDKIHDLTTLSLTPRWDSRWFGVYLPLNYNSMGIFGVGTGVRVGPLMLGTSNIIPYFTKKAIYGADFHVLLKIPILYGKPRDRDGDKVSDKKDKCIDIPGVWEFSGCPDRDGDGIPDTEDECPDEPGPREFNGCPDTDGDGIIDKRDECPLEAGLPQYNGCPDRDGDGIIDRNDECPDVPGLAAFNGCPDTDGDGIPDPKDDCPETPGLTEFNGCPDTDGDGLRDIDDRCPDEPGPVSNQGCPEITLMRMGPGNTVLAKALLQDGKFNFEESFEPTEALFWISGHYSDTITRAMITSPDLRGKMAFRDPDDVFRFPKEAQAVVLTEEEQEVVNKAFDNLEFATGKDLIKTDSYVALDGLAELLTKYPGWKLRIEGHTDNVGNAASNLQLSKKRATAVKNYLVKKGINANRFEVNWYGQTKPIAPNDTEEGRQKNRRVEMTIIE